MDGSLSKVAAIIEQYIDEQQSKDLLDVSCGTTFNPELLDRCSLFESGAPCLPARCSCRSS